MIIIEKHLECKYSREEGAIINFPNNNNDSVSLMLTRKITGESGDNGTKKVEIIVSLKYLSNFCRTLEMPLIRCEINLIFTWSAICVTSSGTAAANQAATFAITDTKLYVPVATLSIKDNSKLLQLLKSGFKRTVNWNIYQSKVTIETQNQYLDYFIDPSF